MHRRRRRTAWAVFPLACLACLACLASANAIAETTLKQAFDAAWARQPEAAALGLRRDAALAQQQAAASWTPEPMALTLANKTDRFQRNEGVRELEVGIAVPLWLPGERMRSGALAEAEMRGVESRALAAQLRTAGALREAWWQRQRAQVELDTAKDQLASARALAADVARRLKAGDLARADQHQADGAVAAAESAEARAASALAVAAQQLRTASGGAVVSASGGALAAPEPEPLRDVGAAPMQPRIPRCKTCRTAQPSRAALQRSRPPDRAPTRS